VTSPGAGGVVIPLHRAGRWVSADGITIDAIRLTHTPNRKDGAWLCIRHPNGVQLAMVRRFPGDIGWLAAHGLGPLTEVRRGRY
jgi:hypothetical protein